MSAIAGSNRTNLFSLFGKVQRELASSQYLEEAAQHCVRAFYDQFPQSIALARIYVTVPYQSLPAWNKDFVNGLAKAKQITVRDETPVLSLLGTSGAKPAWNDRRKSEGHVGIPLVSAAFADSIPMVARLLNDLGVKLDWIDESAGGAATTKRAEWSGLFHVPDAKTSTDDKNRNVIPARDFVNEQNVKTVFGVGGSYPNNTFFAMIFFTREEIAKDAAERFLPLVTTFKTGTAEMVQQGRIFR